MIEQPKSIQLDDVLITEELSRRSRSVADGESPRQPNLQAENQAMRSLAQQLAQTPEKMLQHLVDLAMELCNADTAGVSLFETQSNDEVDFRWVAIAGRLASSVGDRTPHHSPSGICLEQGSAVLFAYPERYFTYLQTVNTPLVECLVLPLIADGQALGTLWLVIHDEQRQFDGEDVRLMTGLADFTATLLCSQQQTRESQTRFRQVFDNNMVAMGIWTPTGAITDANDALLDLIGYTRTDLEAGAIRWSELTPPEYHERDQQAVAEVKAKGACTPYEKEFIRKDGHRQPILIGSGRLDDQSGTGIFCTFDISDRKRVEDERKQTEAALRESEEKYRALFESMDEGYAVVEVMADDNGVWNDFLYLEVNPAFMKQTGMEYPVGRKATELLGTPNPRWAQVYGRVAATGEPIRFEEGEATLGRVFDLYVFRLGGDGSRHVAVLFTDITDRKRTEGVLQANAERQSFLLEFSDALRPLVDAEDICYQAACILGQYLGANRVGYADAEDDNETIIITRNYTNGVPSIEGRYRYGDYGSDLLREFRAGRTVVRSDIANDPSLSHEEKAAHAILQLGATVNVPLIKAGRLVAVLFVHFQAAHEWSDRELALIAEVAERIWDAVERVRAEVALRESEAKYRSLFNSMDEGYFLCDVIFDKNNSPIDIFYVDANPAATQMVGSDYTGRRLRDIDPSYEAYWYEIFGRVARTGQGERLQQYAEPDQKWYDFYVFKVGDTSSHRVAVVFQDISDRKQAELELQKFVSLADNSGEFIGMCDMNFVPFYVNPAGQQLVGLDNVQQYIETSVRDFFFPEDQDFIINEVFPRVLQEGRAEVEIRFRHFKTGAALWMIYNAFYIRGKNNQPIGLATVSRNITDRKHIEAERERLLEREQAAREEAERVNRIKDEFLAILSHELRSPLNPILGWSKLLQSGKLDETKTAQALATIERNAKLQSELIEDLLNVSRILRGKFSLNVAPVNLAATIRGAMETVRLAAEAKSIQITANLSPNVGLVSGDSTRLQQVVWNLLSNAVKFTPPGGQVNIRLERLDSSVQITVHDTGQGIAPDFLPYVFDYFRQADAATTRKFGGLGLGLAIVRHLVELHGGTVGVESPGEGQGTLFTVRLPLIPTPSQANQDKRLALHATPKEAPQQSLDLNGIKILVVDDEPDTRELMAFVLEQQGAQVTATASAHEALLILPQAKPDVLLSDIGMPEIDGYMLIQQVRALTPDQGGQIPAIALTAYAGEIDQQRVIAAGFQKHISKPIEPEVLVQTIVHLIQQT